MSDVSEQALYDELMLLLRRLYHGQEAEEMVETFQMSLGQQPSLEARIAILRHWVDFYRLRKYRRDRQRRRPTYRERVTVCAACGYPVSHRHHLADLATHGENPQTIPLCANCHELEHLLYNALVNESEYSRKLVNHMMYSGRVAFVTFEKLLNWARMTIRYEAAQGWVTTEKASDEWLELVLRWSEFRRFAEDTSA